MAAKRKRTAKVTFEAATLPAASLTYQQAKLMPQVRGRHLWLDAKHAASRCVWCYLKRNAHGVTDVCPGAPPAIAVLPDDRMPV